MLLDMKCEEFHQMLTGEKIIWSTYRFAIFCFLKEKATCFERMNTKFCIYVYTHNVLQLWALNLLFKKSQVGICFFCTFELRFFCEYTLFFMINRNWIFNNNGKRQNNYCYNVWSCKTKLKMHPMNFGDTFMPK